MTSFELCTDCMSGFMGPDKPSRFCNYFIEPHLPTSCGAFTFRGRIRSRAKTSSQEQGPDFYLVGTCELLSYVRASCSQAYGVLVRFFPCRVYIDSSHCGTLIYECSLSLQSSHSMFGVLLVDSRSWIWIWSQLYYHYDYCIYLPLTLTWVNVLLVYACSSL
jgi:hypothetical protein